MIFSKMKPSIQSGYLNKGFGQLVTYLDVPAIGMKQLKDDVAAGAKQYQQLVEFLEGKPSKYVVIRATNMEEGLMAISYLAGEFNQREGLHRSFAEEAYAEELSKEEPSISANDEINEEYEEENEDDEDNGDLFGSSAGGWEESPWRIPIVPYDEVIQNNSMEFGSRNSMMLGMVMPTPESPYWYGLHQESVIISQEIKNGVCFCRSEDILDSDNPLIRGLKRFEHAKHIYLLYVVPPKKILLGNELYENGMFGDGSMNLEKALSEEFDMLMLRYLAEYLSIDQSLVDQKNYFRAMLCDVVESHGFSLSPKCSTEKVLDKIMKVSANAKVELLDLVVRYCTKGKKPGSVLLESDFEALTRFERLASKQESSEEAVTSLQRELVGLEEQKEEINRIVAILEFQKKRKALGLPTGNFRNTLLLIGPPGTAKTTWAKLCGRIMMEKGLLPGSRFTAVNGAQLKGKYVGHTAPKVHSLFEENDIILIDEAYSLTAKDGNGEDTFSQEAVAQLLTEMEEHAMDKLIIFAGYGGKELGNKDNLMKQFLDSNPGIRSRINMTIHFDAYSPNQMLEILKRLAQNNGYQLDKSMDGEITAFFEKRMKDPNFGNGREARSLLDNAISFAALRVSKRETKELTMKAAQRISAEDIRKALAKMSNSYEQQVGRSSEGFFRFG